MRKVLATCAGKNERSRRMNGRKNASAALTILLLIGSLFFVYNASAEYFQLEITGTKTVAYIGEEINFTLTLTNVGTNTATIDFTPPLFDLYYVTPKGLFRCSDGKFHIQIVLSLTIKPGESYSQTLEWNLFQYRNSKYEPPEPGTYDVQGVCRPVDIETSSPAAITLTGQTFPKLGEVKFRGHVATDEEWGDFVCYGSYYCGVMVEEILHDPNSTLSLRDSVSACYSQSMLLRTGDSVECFGFYWKEIGPLQCLRRVCCLGLEDYYVVRRLYSDLNNDGKVDIQDIAAVASAFGSYVGHPRWNSIADINGDDFVNMIDIALIAKNFGKTAQSQ